MSWRDGFFWRLWCGRARARAGLGLRARSRDPLAEALALPVASELVGARDAPRFAWVESAAGVRNIWFAERGRAARRLTAFDRGRRPAALRSRAEPRRRQPRLRSRRRPGLSRTIRLPNAASRLRAAAPAGLRRRHGRAASRFAVGDGHSPTFSPDGDRLAFTRRGEIWLWQTRRRGPQAGLGRRRDQAAAMVARRHPPALRQPSRRLQLRRPARPGRAPDPLPRSGPRLLGRAGLLARRPPGRLHPPSRRPGRRRPGTAALIGRSGSSTPPAGRRASSGPPRRAPARAITNRAARTCSGAGTASSSSPGSAAAGFTPMRSTPRRAERPGT